MDIKLIKTDTVLYFCLFVHDLLSVWLDVNNLRGILI